ncbi:hypothetical protein ZYGM_003372 [Zygosaccharomyces mellis]|uniref:Uncharacterized protein n=1 Tax=Zygosaccharomyces mellis TaxID=42258 RepID=A0A4C2E5D8_9SACH|nr:hypothetical protein ZYGM_003372 [Zygosaccharomyces mellis]
MVQDLLLISHSVCKKKAIAKAQLSPISSTGEFVTTYYALTRKKKVSKRQRLKSKLLKYFSRVEDAFSTCCDTNRVVQLSDNGDINRVPEKNLDGNDYVKSTIRARSNYNPRKRNSVCCLDKLRDFSNPFYPVPRSSGSSKLFSEELTPILGAQSTFVDKDSKLSKKCSFGILLNQKCCMFGYRELTLVLNGISVEAAEEVAKFASIVEKLKAVAKVSGITVVVYVRMGTATLGGPTSHDTAVKIVRKVCKDVLRVSLMPRWNNFGCVRLWGIYHYELNFEEWQYWESFQRSCSRNGITEMIIEDRIEEAYDEKELKAISPIELFAFGDGVEKENDVDSLHLERNLLSEVFEECSELNCLDRKYCTISPRTKKWMCLLVAQFYSFGRRTNIVRRLGDGIDVKLIEIDRESCSRSVPLEIDNITVGEWDDGLDLYTLEVSWIDIFLSHIECGSSPSGGISGRMDAERPVDASVSIPEFCLNVGSHFKSDGATLKSDFEVITENLTEETEVRADKNNTLDVLTRKELDSLKDISSLDCDNHLLDFSEAYLRIEVLNSYFEQITSEVDKIVSGTSRGDILNDLPLGNCQYAVVTADELHYTLIPFNCDHKFLTNPEDILELHDRKYGIGHLFPTFTEIPEVQVKVLPIQIDIMPSVSGKGKYQGSREVCSASKENKLYLDLNIKSTISQIDELLSLIDIAMIATTNEDSKIGTQFFFDLMLQDITTVSTSIAGRYCGHSVVKSINFSATETENVRNYLSCQGRNNDSKNPLVQVDALIAQIDVDITILTSNG